MSAQPRNCVHCAGPIPSRRGSASLYCSGTCSRKAKDRRQRNRKWTSIPPTTPPPPARCWPCGKLACLTREAAKASKRAIETQTGHVDEVRYYECPEGWWHWTRMDANLDGWRARAGESA